MLSVKRWCYLSNRNKSSVVFVPSGRFSISSFLSIYPLYTDCSHFPKIFFSFFLALFQFEDYFFFFTRNVITHTKLTRIDRSIERIFGNKGEIFWKFFFFFNNEIFKGEWKRGEGTFCIKRSLTSANQGWEQRTWTELKARTFFPLLSVYAQPTYTVGTRPFCRNISRRVGILGQNFRKIRRNAPLNYPANIFFRLTNRKE